MELLLRMGINQAILAPEPVELGAVLGVAVGDYFSTMAAANDEHPPQLVAGEVFLVALDIQIARFEYHVTAFTVVYRVEDRLVTLVYPVLRHTRLLLKVSGSFLLEKLTQSSTPLRTKLPRGTGPNRR